MENIEKRCVRQSSRSHYSCGISFCRFLLTCQVTLAYQILWKKPLHSRTRSGSYPRRCSVNPLTLFLCAVLLILHKQSLAPSRNSPHVMPHVKSTFHVFRGKMPSKRKSYESHPGRTSRGRCHYTILSANPRRRKK